MYKRPESATLTPKHSEALEKDLFELEEHLAEAERLGLLTDELKTFRQATWPAGRELVQIVTSTNERNTDARLEQETP